MACGLQFCNLHLLLDNQLFNEKELLIIFHKINLKVNNLCYNCLKTLETCIYSPPRTKELLCPVLEKGRWIAKHSLKTQFQAAKQKIEKNQNDQGPVSCVGAVSLICCSSCCTATNWTPGRGYEWAIPCLIQWCTVHTYMLFAGWEVRIVKNCDRGLENAARGQHFQVRGHSFSLYGPTLSQ